MINKFKTKSEFSKNVLTLMTGTVIAQAIPIAISPILTRIYTPEDFGVFALFVAIISILGSIANARYELAIMLPKKDEDAINIFALGFIITCAISIFILILVVFLNDYFVNLLGNKEIGFWLYFVPLSVFVSGLYNIVYYFNNRRKNYKDLRNATIFKSIILAIIQLSVGVIKSGANGLIFGQLLSNMFANLRLLRNILKDKVLVSKISKVKIVALSKRYKKFPKYLLVAHGINSLSEQSQIILFSSFFSANTVGFLAFAQRILSIPTSIIAQSIGDVFRQEAIICYNQNKECLEIYISTFKKLLIIAILPFSILFFLSPFIFDIIFGENWRIAGEYAQVLIPMYFLQFVTSPLSQMYIIAEKQKLDLYWQIYLLFSVVSSILISYYLFKDAYITLIAFAIAYSIAYLVNIVFTYNFAKGK